MTDLGHPFSCFNIDQFEEIADRISSRIFSGNTVYMEYMETPRRPNCNASSVVNKKNKSLCNTTIITTSMKVDEWVQSRIRYNSMLLKGNQYTKK